MNASTSSSSGPRMFLDIPRAAQLAGFSTRHFRRIIEEDHIRIVEIGRKFFILGTDFEQWRNSNRPKKRGPIRVS